MVRVDVVLECPWGPAVGTQCPFILSHQQFIGAYCTPSFTHRSLGLQELSTATDTGRQMRVHLLTETHKHALKLANVLLQVQYVVYKGR